ncbi:hypothetical protein N7481_011901 [Penicillium waksmanii]|uniref:uncharacterized protein n=1 Tax=Penicillium waksmanii TaxID=69791 RepID=UPI0025484F25|nr:uncharacterized protein N7481_011901 [Penicillium waksmanii]KAJ5974691.1 hypothetical protein N7481_011901 [Penicillium waksmanii]
MEWNFRCDNFEYNGMAKSQISSMPLNTLCEENRQHDPLDHRSVMEHNIFTTSSGISDSAMSAESSFYYPWLTQNPTTNQLDPYIAHDADSDGGVRLYLTSQQDPSQPLIFIPYISNGTILRGCSYKNGPIQTNIGRKSRLKIGKTSPHNG